MILIFEFCLLFAMGVVSVSCHWTYGDQKDSHEWIGQCTTGKHQSPIQILSNETTPAYMKPFIFEFYGNPPVAETLTNNGHSVTFTLKAVREIAFPKIVGGGLPGVYQFEQFHFHWGSVDERGSEHNIDGANHPMELHLVHFNALAGSSVPDAMNNSKTYDTLAVISILFEIQEEDNPAIHPITDALKFIKFQDDLISNVTLFPMENVLPKNRDHFYRYNGSLTTPPCSEIVIWTIFKEPIYISENQMNKFRAVGDLPRSSGTFESESDNFRAIQKLNDRQVLLVDTRIHFLHDDDASSPSDSSYLSSPSKQPNILNQGHLSNQSNPSYQSPNEKVTMLIDPEVIETYNSTEDQSDLRAADQLYEKSAESSAGTLEGKPEETTAESKEAEVTTSDSDRIRKDTESETTTTTTTTTTPTPPTTADEELDSASRASHKLESTRLNDEKTGDTQKTTATPTTVTPKQDDHAQAHGDKGHSLANKFKSHLEIVTTMTLILISIFNFY